MEVPSLPPLEAMKAIYDRLEYDRQILIDAATASGVQANLTALDFLSHPDPSPDGAKSRLQQSRINKAMDYLNQSISFLKLYLDGERYAGRSLP